MTLIPLNTTYLIPINTEIGNSGSKIVFAFCYSGDTSSHCTYWRVAVANMGYSDRNQYGNYTAYDNIYAEMDWRNSAWENSRHSWTFEGVDGVTYHLWQNEDKNFYYEVTALPAPVWTCNVPFDGYETDQYGNLRKNADGTCTPSVWKCNEPKDGFETDQYGNTKENTDCKEVIIPDIIQDIIPDIIPKEITKYLPYIILIIGIIAIYFIIRK